MSLSHPPFLSRPGENGPFGALMDEYGRAAEAFCQAVEATVAERYAAERPSLDPDTVSIRAICAHVVGAAHRYADYIREARGLPFVDRFVVDPESVREPAAVRPALAASIRYTEEALAGWYEDPEPAYQITFQVRWGRTYDADMILEHAVMHLLRHRRQIERWSD